MIDAYSDVNPYCKLPKTSDFFLEFNKNRELIFIAVGDL